MVVGGMRIHIFRVYGRRFRAQQTTRPQKGSFVGATCRRFHSLFRSNDIVICGASCEFVGARAQAEESYGAGLPREHDKTLGGVSRAR